MRKTVVFCCAFITMLNCFAISKNDDKKRDGITKQNSVFFKMSRNSDRLGLFWQIQSTLKVKSKNAPIVPNNTAPTTMQTYSTIDEIVELFGEPTAHVKNQSFVYTLNPQNGCKGIIEFDNKGFVVYITVRDCKNN